jgi:cytochrome bd ubiquinol oxidase subunit II
MAYAWFVIVLLCLVMYVTLDGYDLGIGALLLTEADRDRRREMVEIVATAWDGNETWIIILAVALWGGLPEAYGAMLPALYLPLIVMFFALVWRGVAVEMISQSGGLPRRWTLSFGVGSLVAAFAQGMAMGGLLSGVLIRDRRFAGPTFGFFSGYSVLTGITAVVLYGLAGAAFLRLKAEGRLRDRATAAGRVLLALTAVLALVCALSLPATATSVHLNGPVRVTLFVIFAVVAAGGFVLAWIGFDRGPDRLALTGVATAEVAGLAGLVTVVVPVIVPPGLTVQAASAPGLTFDLLLFGVGANVPLLLFYSWYSHRVFRGKWRVPASQRPPGISAAGYAISGPHKEAD